MAEKSTEKAPGAFSLLGTASTMGLHMVSGPVVGGGLGWLVDHWLDSWPVGASIGLVLGLAAGFRNVWADARYLEHSNAVIDAERKKQEEAGQKPEKSLKNGNSEGKKLPSVELVPSVHKESGEAEKAEKDVSAALPEEKAGEASDSYMASILAGTASPQERELEELDETMEAIRRVLEGDDQREAGKDGASDVRKGQV